MSSYTHYFTCTCDFRSGVTGRALTRGLSSLGGGRGTTPRVGVKTLDEVPPLRADSVTSVLPFPRVRSFTQLNKPEGR